MEREVELHKKVKEKGVTMVPLEIYFNGSRVKVAVALCKGKKLYDKRETLRDRDVKRQVARELAHRDR